MYLFITTAHSWELIKRARAYTEFLNFVYVTSALNLNQVVFTSYRITFIHV